MEKDTASIANASSQKKISFFAAILIVMGSSIGAGIFFKSSSVLAYSQMSLVLAIFCWLIAAVSVICMALALIEIASARNDNLSLLGWTKVFCGKTLFKASKNFMFFVYLPLTYFFMPLYVIMSLQDGIGALINSSFAGDNTDPLTFNTNVDWLIWTIISLAISIYFIIVSGYSSKAGNIQNKIITYIKFIPLAAVAIIGFALAGLNGAQANANITTLPNAEASIYNGANIEDFMPGLGLFLAIGAIYFAYDGFYVTAGIQSEMKAPKKTPVAIFIGLSITTVIYLIIAIAMSINGDGDFFSMQITMQEEFGTQTANILFGIINIMIAIGVIGIINGFAMWAPRFTEDLIKEGELPFSANYLNKLNDNKPKVGICYSLVITIPIVLIFTLIGALGYLDTGGYSFYGSGMGGLYSFADLMATWASLFAFVFIALAIYGGIKNRKTNKVKTDQKSYFLPTAYISVAISIIAMAVTVLIPIINMFLLSQLSPDVNDYDPDLVYVDLVTGRVLLVIVLLLFIGLMFIPTWIEDHNAVKRFGSLQKYESWKKDFFPALKE